MKKIIAACLLAFFSVSAFAGKQAFTEDLYKQYQENGDVFLVDVYATWCPTCKKQQKIIKQYLDENPESDLKVLIVDYDDQKKWVSHFRAPRQSTLLLYKGSEQLWFSVAETSKKKIFAKLAAAEQ